jgi:hypothetical protein
MTKQLWAQIVSCIINIAAYGRVATRGETTQDRQYRYNVTMRVVLATIVAVEKQLKTKLHGLSPRANYTDRAAAAGRRS